MPLPPTLVVGRGRAYGLQIISHLSSHLSITGLSVIFPFSPSHLALALRTLHPPARVITIGGAYSDDEADQARGVWEEYRKEVEEKPEEYGEEDKGVKTCFVRVKGVKEGGAAAVAERGRGGLWESGRVIVLSSYDFWSGQRGRGRFGEIKRWMDAGILWGREIEGPGAKDYWRG